MIRVPLQNNQAKYDARHDVLHVYLYPSRLSFDDELFPGIVVRRDIDDEDVITGLTILDYSKRNPQTLESMLPLFDFTTLGNIVH